MFDEIVAIHVDFLRDAVIIFTHSLIVKQVQRSTIILYVYSLPHYTKYKLSEKKLFLFVNIGFEHLLRTCFMTKNVNLTLSQFITRLFREGRTNIKTEEAVHVRFHLNALCVIFK